MRKSGADRTERGREGEGGRGRGRRAQVVRFFLFG